MAMAGLPIVPGQHVFAFIAVLITLSCQSSEALTSQWGWRMDLAKTAPAVEPAFIEEASTVKHSESKVLTKDFGTDEVSPAPAGAPRGMLIPQEALLGSLDTMMSAAKEVMASNSTKAKLQRERISYMWVEQVLQKSLNSLAVEAQQRKVAEASAAVALETKSPGAAALLSTMRSELQTFSAPFYQQALEEEIKSVQAKQKVLLDKIVDLESDAPNTTRASVGVFPPASGNLTTSEQVDMAPSWFSKAVLLVAVALLVAIIASLAFFFCTKRRLLS